MPCMLMGVSSPMGSFAACAESEPAHSSAQAAAIDSRRFMSGCPSGDHAAGAKRLDLTLGESGRAQDFFSMLAARRYGTGHRGCAGKPRRSEEHTSELQSHHDLVCRLLLEKKKKNKKNKIKQKQKKTTRKKQKD